MDENKRFELAIKLKELRDEKDELEQKVKDLNAEIEDIQKELISDLVDNDSTGFNYKGFNFSLVIKEYPSAETEEKSELYRVMKERGFEHLFTINSQTLSATLKELKANNDDIMPDWLDGLVKITEKSSIRISRAKKSNK